MKILDQLNSSQQEAVTAEEKHLLILAGAGSGKTRVLVYRIAWLMQHQNISPYAIFSVTFTNKAANEMRGRIEMLNQSSVSGMWMGTFHSLAHRFLRMHWQDARLPQTFQILDADDQHRVIRRIIKSLNLDEEQWKPKQAQWYINQQKEEGKRSKHLNPRGNIFEEVLLKVYKAYEETCEKSGLVDFAELLLRTCELLQEQPALLEHYRQRFNYILVDEFQDTNSIQYTWLRLLAGDNNHLMIVGDDDQSIYGWRGAKIENIFRFQKDFPETRIVRLEQNYRSTGNILKAANALITNNEGRMGKNLWTEVGDGEPVLLYNAYNDRDEARYVANQIAALVRQDTNYSECAVLYRSNAQSRVIEETLMQMGIPYRVYGGMRFFERAEIKDALAYLQLILRNENDAAFERILNTPTRGIGDRTVELLREIAKKEQLSLWQAAKWLLQQSTLSPRAAHALLAFLNLIERLALEVQTMNLFEKTDHVLTQSGLMDHYRKEKGEKGQVRVENLEELLSAVKQYETESENKNPQTLLEEFLAHAALEAGDGQSDDFTNCVQLMTLHSAKGLEFPVVFLTGLEENLFPHQMSMDSTTGLEEERRLCYVGITRAKKKLYLTYSEMRRLYGREMTQRPSRFLKEIPDECMDTVREKPKVSRPLSFVSPTVFRSPSAHKQSRVIETVREATEDGLSVGQAIDHKAFGEGVIINIEGHGLKARLQIRFKKVGVKWLVAELAMKNFQ